MVYCFYSGQSPIFLTCAVMEVRCPLCCHKEHDLTGRCPPSIWLYRTYSPLSETIFDSSPPSSSFVYYTMLSFSLTAFVPPLARWSGDHGSQPLRSLWPAACMYHGTTEEYQGISSEEKLMRMLDQRRRLSTPEKARYQTIVRISRRIRQKTLHLSLHVHRP